MIFRQPHEMITDDVFLDLEGLVGGSDVFLKLEGMNPAGSIKLKPAVAMVEDAERRGVLWPGGRMIESSSGSLGIALAMIAASKGYSFTCVVDPNVSPQSLDVTADEIPHAMVAILVEQVDPSERRPGAPAAIVDTSRLV